MSRSRSGDVMDRMRLYEPDEWGNNPFFYNPHDDALYVANNGGSHHELRDRHGLDTGNAYAGRYRESYDEGEPGMIEWYLHQHPDKLDPAKGQEIHDFLGTGETYEDATGGWDWDFTSSVQSWQINRLQGERPDDPETLARSEWAPMWYHPKKRIVHIAPYGWHHQDILEHLGWMEGAEERPRGFRPATIKGPEAEGDIPDQAILDRIDFDRTGDNPQRWEFNGAVHALPCPHCGEKALHDDTAAGLHCHNCGRQFRMGWDDPESWMEGKFDWDFNLPLEGMSEIDEPDNPEASWVIPTRNYGPVHHGAYELGYTGPVPEGGLYHEAPTEERARILHHGLHPAMPRRNKEQWGDNPKYLRDQPEGVYAWRNAPPHRGPSMDIWRIPKEQVEDYMGDPMTSGVIVKHVVYPELYMGGPEMTEGKWPMKPEDIPSIPTPSWWRPREAPPGTMPGGSRTFNPNDKPEIVNPDKEIRVWSSIQDFDMDAPYEEQVYHGYNNARHMESPLRGGWLTTEPKEALQYASEHEGLVRPFRVRLENPFHTTAEEAGMALITGALAREARDMGYDGLVIHKKPTGPSPMEPSQEWGEHRHVVPFDYSKVEPVTRTSSSRSLYHGTLLDHLPSIQQHGLIPDIGPFVSDAYDLDPEGNYHMDDMGEERTFTPEELNVQPLVFMTDRARMRKALNAIIHNVGHKLNKGFHEVTPLDVRNHGLLVKHKGEMWHEEKPPFEHVFDENVEEGHDPWDTERSPYEGHPHQAEPGDFYSDSPVGNLEFIHGPAMMRVFERNNVAPRNSPFAWNVVQNAMGREAWHVKTGSLNMRKLYTTAEDHERGKRRWGFPRPHQPVRQAAADPQWLQRWIEANGPYMVHQTDGDQTREKIMQEGLIPHDQGPGSQYSGSLVPRANHVYASRNLASLDPSDKGVRRFDLTYNDRGETAGQRRTVAIDLRKLDPSRINPDEDAFDPSGNYRSRVPANFPLEQPADVPAFRRQNDDVPEDGMTWHRQRIHDSNGGVFENGGEWADRNNITQPHHTAWSMNTIGNAAIQGGVPPEALVRPKEAFEDLQANYPHAVAPSFGRYHTPIEPPESGPAFQWHYPQVEQLVRTASPVTPAFWESGEEAGVAPPAWYHGTSPAHLESIMQHGLVPWDSDLAGGSAYTEGWLQPRPGHVYLHQDPQRAHELGLNAEVARLEPGTNVEEQVYNPKTITFKIDPRYLHHEHVNPDEDYMPGASFDERDKELVDKYKSLGNMAEQFGWGDIPHETERHIVREKPIAYRGVIPPEALTPGRVKFGEWKPLAEGHSAAVIGEMRNAYGRFATAVPWELGKWGKGLFFPETGVLQLWSDERGHNEVWEEDENAYSTEAFHLIVRPDGSVRSQGSLNRNYENTDADLAELAQALREFDPHLKLDKSDAWEFGPTEPMETEPSSISRGEEGGKDSPTLQTSNDYAGSL